MTIDLIGTLTRRDIEMGVHRSRVTDDDVTYRIKIEAHIFGGAHDPKVFSN